MTLPKVKMEKDAELSEEQEKVCRGMACYMEQHKPFHDKIAEEVMKRMEEKMNKMLDEKLAKVIAVAEVESESKEFKAKKKVVEFNKQMKTPIQEEEEE